MTLYELTDDYLRLLELAEEDVDEQILNDTMEGIEGAIEDKADAYAAVVFEIDSDIAKIDREVSRLSDRKRALTNNRDRIKKNLYNAMIAMNKRKIKTGLHSFTISKNGGKLPLILNEGVRVEDLPMECIKVSYTADSEALRALLDKGDTRFAHYGERGETLRIK